MSDIPITMPQGGGFSPAVESIFSRVLTAIHDGQLTPGQHIQDFQLAERFAVSRTPVREALQRLRDIGVVEAVAGRFTRIAIMDAETTGRSVATWSALYRGIVADVAHSVPPEVLDLMKQDRERYERLLPEGDFRAIAGASFAFFDRLLPLTSNHLLVTSLDRVAQLVRIGIVYLPETVDVVALEHVQEELLAALEKGDRARAMAAIDILQEVQIPSHPRARTWRRPE